MLIVHIGEIDVDPIGYTMFDGSNGAMPGWLGGTRVGVQSKVVEIRDGLIHWSDILKISARPMLGFVGAAPGTPDGTTAGRASGEATSTIP
jgi:amidase